MTESRATRTDQPTVALAVLLVVVGLVLASPIGWFYVLPALGDVFTAVWAFLTAACTAALDGVLTTVDGLTGILAG